MFLFTHLTVQLLDGSSESNRQFINILEQFMLDLQLLALLGLGLAQDVRYSLQLRLQLLMLADYLVDELLNGM